MHYWLKRALLFPTNFKGTLFKLLNYINICGDIMSKLGRLQEIKVRTRVKILSAENWRPRSFDFFYYWLF